MNFKVIISADMLIFLSFFFLALFMKLKSKLDTELFRVFCYSIQLLCFLILLPLYLIKLVNSKKFADKIIKMGKPISKVELASILFKVTYFNLYDLLDFIVNDFSKFEAKRQKSLNAVRKVKVNTERYDRVGSAEIKTYYKVNHKIDALFC